MQRFGGAALAHPWLSFWLTAFPAVSKYIYIDKNMDKMQL